VEHCSCLGDIIIDDAKCTHESTSRVANTKAAINKKTTIFNSKLTRLQLNDETTKVLHLKHSFSWHWNKETAERIPDIPGSCEMWCRRRVETSWTDRMRNEVQRKVKQDWNINIK